MLNSPPLKLTSHLSKLTAVSIQGGDRRHWPVPAMAMAVAAVIVLATGCGTSARRRTGDSGGLPIGSSTQRLSVGGMVRTFHMYRPVGLSGPAPLVVMLHGGFGSGTQAKRAYGWDAQADSGHFVVAYPDGLNRAWSAGGGCCGRPGAKGVDDVGFITAMVAHIQRQIAVDPARIYATGISNGGFMSYRLACKSTVFAAIGPDAATQLGDCPSPAPVSIIHIHGTADQSVRYHGGRGTGPARIDGPAIPGLHETWREHNDCDEPKVNTAGTVTTSTAQCPKNRAVTLVTIDGAGHQWPGADQRTTARRILRGDQPSTALNATRTIWQFFNSHPKT